MNVNESPKKSVGEVKAEKDLASGVLDSGIQETRPMNWDQEEDEDRSSEIREKIDQYLKDKDLNSSRVGELMLDISKMEKDLSPDEVFEELMMGMSRKMKHDDFSEEEEASDCKEKECEDLGKEIANIELEENISDISSVNKTDSTASS